MSRTKAEESRSCLESGMILSCDAKYSFEHLGWSNSQYGSSQVSQAPTCQAYVHAVILQTSSLGIVDESRLGDPIEESCPLETIEV